MNSMLVIGDVVTNSPIGPGAITGFNPDGYPEVNGQAVSYLTRADGASFGTNGTLRTPTYQRTVEPIKKTPPPLSAIGGRTTVKVESGFTIKQ